MAKFLNVSDFFVSICYLLGSVFFVVGKNLEDCFKLHFLYV
jgi:hypothetical protein